MFQKTIAISGLAVVLVAASALVTTLPASAATADTSVTAAVASGGLSISAPGDLDLGAITPGQVGRAPLTAITVTDLRAGTAGWAATASISDFRSASLGTTIPSEDASYTPTTATTTGTATVTEHSTTGGAQATTVQEAADVTGNNSASWDAAIALAVPADALASDDYIATLTHSVA
ncbi:WxL domain-containing protein [Curtobacterium sp. ZW137]|uniref:WxL domain-containing protein n=1 Tax=Curtobacterium sp. ZW137 TaxID=2485104 RepID=UPI000F4CE83E|nr:WxL domain-containing protein [Curtobacterium sp. ZW137]ROP65640.1 putative surface cell wall-binding protein [Curtobacterium sp. ZW137]